MIQYQTQISTYTERFIKYRVVNQFIFTPIIVTLYTNTPNLNIFVVTL